MNPKVVLIADDNRDAAETMGLVLGLSGHRVSLAYTGREALEMAEKERPDVVVLDIGMPELDGYEVARRIRAEPWGANMLLIALTGWGQEAAQHLPREAGFTHHLVKPVDPDTLEQLLGD